MLLAVILLARGSSPGITRSERQGYLRAVHADFPGLPATVDTGALAFGLSVCHSGLLPAQRAALLHHPVAGLTGHEVQGAWSEALIHMCPQDNYTSGP